MFRPSGSAARRPIRLLTAVLVPVAGAMLACSGAFDQGPPLGDTATPLDVDVEAHRGSGDGSADPTVVKRPSLQEKIEAIAPRDGHPAGRAKPGSRTTEEQEDDDAGAKPKPGPVKPLRGVEKTGARTWTVKQRLADRWEDDPYDLARVEASGDGWMLRGVRKGDAYHLGMKNKDVVLSVNGRKLKTKSQMLAAYLALKNKKDFEVVFLRRGKQLKHHYKIVQ